MMRFFGVILSVLLMAACTDGNEGPCEVNKSNLVKVGDRVPEFVVDPVRYGTTAFRSKEINKLTLIYFLWSECGDCKRTTPHVMKVWKQMKDNQNFELVCIARGGGEATAERAVAYWNEVEPTIAPTPMPALYYDVDRHVFDKFAASGVPRFYLVQSDGRVVWFGEGELSAEQLMREIERF